MVKRRRVADDGSSESESDSDSSSYSHEAPMPSAKARPKRGKKKPKRRPKYRVMVMTALKRLRDPKGTPFREISMFIEEKYHQKNDFVLKNVLKWLCSKKVVQKTKGFRFKSTGKPLILKDNVITGRPHGSRRRKSMSKRRKSVSRKRRKSRAR